jgi:surface antigen
MKPTILALLLSLSLVSAAPYPLIHTSTLNCRTKPSTSSKAIKTYSKSSDLKLTCQTYGEPINGNNIWDKTTDGCYVSDYYVKTGDSGFVTSKCPGTTTPPTTKVPGPMLNDYIYKGACSGPADKWNFFRCQCVSFVAQRINQRLGIKFTNRYKGKVWGYANQWDEAARASGVSINNTPKPGCVAQTNRGKWGHVAWVVKVQGNSVVVEEYNWNTKLGYGTRTVDKGTFQYIHLTKDT